MFSQLVQVIGVLLKCLVNIETKLETKLIYSYCQVFIIDLHCAFYEIC